MGVLLVSLGGIGAGLWLVSIMGSGPCEPPPCGTTAADVGKTCLASCNGPEGYTCKGIPPDLECMPGAPCDAQKCPPAPPCYTKLCVSPIICGGTSFDLCCRYESTGAGSGCPLAAEDPDDPSTWTGTCSDANVCE